MILQKKQESKTKRNKIEKKAFSPCAFSEIIVTILFVFFFSDTNPTTQPRSYDFTIESSDLRAPKHFLSAVFFKLPIFMTYIYSMYT